MNLIGNDLKMIRQFKKFSLAEISQITKIDPEKLSSIEDGSIFTKSSENETYIRSFVRSYGKALRLDENLVIEALDQQTLGLYDGELIRDFPELAGPGNRVATPTDQLSTRFGTFQTNERIGDPLKSDSSKSSSQEDASISSAPSKSPTPKTAPVPDASFTGASPEGQSDSQSSSIFSDTSSLRSVQEPVETTDRNDDLIRFKEAPIVNPGEGQSTATNSRINAPIRPEWDLDQDDIDAEEALLDGQESGTGKNISPKPLNVRDVDWSKMSHHSTKRSGRSSLWIVITILALVTIGVVIAFAFDVKLPFLNTGSAVNKATPKEMEKFSDMPSAVSIPSVTPQPTGSTQENSSQASESASSPSSAPLPDAASSGAVDQFDGTGKSGASGLLIALETSTSTDAASGNPSSLAAIQRESASTYPAILAGEPILITIFAAYDKLEPVRVWSDLRPDRPEPDPYWVEKGEAIAIEMNERLYIQGQFSRMMVFANGHLIQDLRGRFYEPAFRRIELSRAKLAETLDINRPVPLELPSGWQSPTEVNEIAARLSQ